MKLEKIHLYPVDRQVKYFLKVAVKNSTEAATLKAMQKTRDDDTMFWPDTYETLFFKYGDTKLPYKETRSHMQGVCLVIHMANVTVMEFMMRNVRLSWRALQEVVNRAKINDDMRTELGKYLSKGRINDSQFNILVDAVATEPGSGDLQMLGVLLDYIKSYGISEQQMSRIQSQYSQVFIELVEEKSRFYKQSKLVKSYRNTDQDKEAWRKMCKNLQPIFPEIQEKMSYEQYVIFHETGNELCIDHIGLIHLIVQAIFGILIDIDLAVPAPPVLVLFQLNVLILLVFGDLVRTEGDRGVGRSAVSAGVGIVDFL
jgi:hypothetical protein